MLTRFTPVALVQATLWATLASAEKYPMGTGLSCSFLPKDCVPDPANSKFCMSKDMECRAFRWSQSNPKESMIPLFEYSESWTHEDATKLVEDSYKHYKETGQIPVINGADFPKLPVCYDPDGHMGEMRLGLDHHQLADNEITFPCWCGQDGSEFYKFANAGGFMTKKWKPVILDRCYKLSKNDAEDSVMSPVEHFAQVCAQWHDERDKPPECDQIVSKYAALLAQKLSIPEATCRMFAAPIWTRVTGEYWGNIWKDRFLNRVDYVSYDEWMPYYASRHHCFDSLYSVDHYGNYGEQICDTRGESCGCKNQGAGENAGAGPAWDGHHNLAWWVQSDMFNELFDHYADHMYRNGEQIMCSGQYCLQITCQTPINATEPVSGAQIVELLTRKAGECPHSDCATMQLQRATGYSDGELYSPKGLLELEKVDKVQCAGLCGANEPARPVLTKGDSGSGRPCIGKDCPGGSPS